MFHTNKLNNSKWVYNTKIVMTSCAIFANTLFSGCANTSSSMLMKKTEKKLELSESDLGGSVRSEGSERRSNTGSMKSISDLKNVEPNKHGSIKKAVFVGLIAALVGAGIATAIEVPVYNERLDDKEDQIAYLQSKNEEMTNVGISLANQLNTANLQLTAMTSQNSNLTDQLTSTSAQLQQVQDTLTSTSAQLQQVQTTLTSTLNPDYFETLQATMTPQGGTPVALTLQNALLYKGKSDVLSISIDQTSGSDINSVPLVAALLEHQGPLVVNLLSTNYAICNSVGSLDLSGFNKAQSIDINGELYVPIIGPADKDVNTGSTSPIALSIYDLNNDYFDVADLVPCGGQSSFIKSANTPPINLADTSTSPNPLINKLNGEYGMTNLDISTCYGDLLSQGGTNFLNSGTLPNGNAYNLYETLIINNDNNGDLFPSNSIVWGLIPKMPSLNNLIIRSSSVVGSVLSNSIAQMNTAQDSLCIVDSTIIGDVSVPSGIILSCANFASPNFQPSSNSNWPQLYGDFLHQSLLVNSKFTVGFNTGDTEASRVPLYQNRALNFTSNQPYYGVTTGSAFFWSTNTNTPFSSNYAPGQTSYAWGDDNSYVGDCFVGA